MVRIRFMGILRIRSAGSAIIGMILPIPRGRATAWIKRSSFDPLTSPLRARPTVRSLPFDPVPPGHAL
jgi:hypothetical protein